MGMRRAMRLPLGMLMLMQLPLAMGLLCSFLLGAVSGGSVAANASVLGASVSPIQQQTTAETTAEEEQINTTDSTTTTDTGVEPSCGPLLPPRRGSYYVEQGTGSSLGSVLVFWCREGYQLLGRERLSCVLHNGNARWSHSRPACEGLPVPDGHGLRMAIVVSAVSGVVIIFLTVAFVVCCMRDQQQSKKKKSQRSGRARGRWRRKTGARRSAAWQEREPGDWDVFPPPKIYNLSQQLEPPHTSTGSPAYTPARGYDNRGYLRSQDSLVRSPLGGMYRSDAQLYSHLMLQRAAVPDSPAYLNISAPPTLKNPQRPRA